MKISEITHFLESLAPLATQENYDNCGLIVGDKNQEITRALITLDCTEAVVDEAIKKNCNLIIAHHPVLFKSLKKLNGKNYVEKALIKAIKNDISIYAIHTNLDNYQFGVNKKIGDLLGIQTTKILRPTENSLLKLSVFVPESHVNEVAESLFIAGAGNIGNYSDCSFSSSGTGTFKANDQAKPFVGEVGKRHEESEFKLEVIVPVAIKQKVVSAMIKAHPYEEVAFDLIPLLNENKFSGAGMFGELPEPLDEKSFLTKLQATFKTPVIKHTPLLNKKIKRVAWCGGSGSFLISDAIQSKADIFITADIKYHDFFDADNQIVMADIGHFESEQFTIDQLYDLLQEKFPNFAPLMVETVTNPINYFK